MVAQNKRAGATAKKERVARVKERQEFVRYRNAVKVVLFQGRQMYDGYTGKRVALGIPPEEETA